MELSANVSCISSEILLLTGLYKQGLNIRDSQFAFWKTEIYRQNWRWLVTCHMKGTSNITQVVLPVAPQCHELNISEQ